MPRDVGARSKKAKVKGGGRPPLGASKERPLPLDPTKISLDTKENGKQSLPKAIHPTTVHFKDHNGNRVTWHSRRARKGRYNRKHYHITRDDNSTHSLLLRMRPEDKVIKPHIWGDVTFWVALTFTFGSMLWLVNGFLVWLPYLYPNVGRHGIQNAALWVAFAGGLVFVIGSFLMVVEALDRGRENNFGTSIKRILTHQDPGPIATPIATPTSSAPSSPSSAPTSTSTSSSGSSPNESSYSTDTSDSGTEPFPWREDKPGFVWFGKAHWRNIGWDAAFVQFLASVIFWVATIVGIPGVVSDSQRAIIDVFYWTTQVVGGAGFVLSGFLLMLEVQDRWWKPKPFDIGWQISFWNFIGGIGFTLCGALGYAYKSHRAKYQSGLSTFWASWAFMIASVMQLYEALWREKPDSVKDKESEA